MRWRGGPSRQRSLVAKNWSRAAELFAAKPHGTGVKLAGPHCFYIWPLRQYEVVTGAGPLVLYKAHESLILQIPECSPRILAPLMKGIIALLVYCYLILKSIIGKYFLLRRAKFWMSEIKVEAKLVWVHIMRFAVTSGGRFLPVNINVALRSCPRLNVWPTVSLSLTRTYTVWLHCQLVVWHAHRNFLLLLTVAPDSTWPQFRGIHWRLRGGVEDVTHCSFHTFSALFCLFFSFVRFFSPLWILQRGCEGQAWKSVTMTNPNCWILKSEAICARQWNQRRKNE